MNTERLDDILEDLAKVVSRIDAVDYGALPFSLVTAYMNEVRSQARELLRLAS